MKNTEETQPTIEQEEYIEEKDMKDNKKFGRNIEGENNPMYGKKHSIDTLRKMSGENSHMWKGDKVGYKGLHLWIRRHKPKSETCEDCGQKKKLYAANISGEYKRDINDFEWLCAKCHLIKDGNTVKMLQSPKRLLNIPRGENHYAYGKPELSPTFGKKRSKETKKKISKNRKGISPWNKGIKIGPNHKISASKKGTVPWNKGIKNFKVGKKELLRMKDEVISALIDDAVEERHHRHDR